MQIRTFYAPPPIPMRQYDWTAYDADEYEPGHPVGYGRTEQEAIDDFHRRLAEWKEDRGNPL